MVKLLHLADVHLSGRLYVAAPALLKRARAVHRTTLRRAIQCALREAVDAVLIAGDLFDGRCLDYDAEQFLLEQLARLDAAGIPCFYAVGRADSRAPRFRGDAVDWPASLHRFAEPSPQAVTLEGDDGRPLARIVGAGPTGLTGDEHPRTGFPPSDGSVPHVGVLHTPLAGADGVAPSAHRGSALAPETLRQTGYAYWALGHVHRRQQADEEAHAWYAGPLMGRYPSEPGPQGGLLVTLEAGQAPHVVFQPFAPLCWADVVLDGLEEVRTQHTLLQRAHQAFADQYGAEAPAGWFARFTFVGGCPLAPALHDPATREQLETALTEHLGLEAAFVRQRHLTLPAEPDRHRDEPHVLSEALALIDRAADDPTLLQELAPDVLAAPSNSSDPEAYLRALTEALDREACTHLLRKTLPE